MKKCIISLVVVLSLLAGSSLASAKEVVIGFSQATLDSPFYVALMDAAKKKAEEMGAKLLYVDAQGDIAKQNKDVQDLLTKGIDVLLLNAVNPGGVTPAIRSALQADVPVIAVDRPANGKIVTFVGRDNKNMGYEAGKLAVELLGGKGKATGKVIELQGAAGGKVMMDRRDGFHQAIDAEKGVTVIQSPYCEYIRSKAVKAFQDLYEANQDVTLVYGHNDDMVLGAAQVLKQNGKLGTVKLVGVDGLMQAVKAIADGTYDGTVLNDPGLLGSMAVETAVGIVNGKKYPEFIDAGTGLITKDNAAKYVDDSKVFAETK